MAVACGRPELSQGAADQILVRQPPVPPAEGPVSRGCAHSLTRRDICCRALHRRSFLSTTTTGIGSAVLASLVAPELLRRASAGEGATAGSSSSAASAKSKPRLDHWPGVVRPLHHPAKIKRVIF